MFDYVAAYMYDGDTPIAERRAGALTLDRDLLRELLGQEELRELLDPDALADLELSLQALTDDRRATTLDGVHDLLRRLGDLSAAEVAARTEGGDAAAGPWLDELAAARRAVRTRVAGDDRWLAIEDVARYRDGVGITPPVGIPAAFLGPAAGALDGLLSRYARTHGPFLTPDPARRWGLPGRGRRRRARAAARRRFAAPWRVPAGRRRARMVRPRGPASAAPPLPRPPATRGRTGRSGRAGPVPARVAGRGGARPRRDRRSARTAALERLAEVVDQLAGLPIPASVLERDVLPARVAGYQPRLLDELGALGEVAWVGRGSLGRDDGRVALVRPGREILRPLGTPDGTESPMEPRHVAIRDHLAARGASFYRELFAAARGTSDREVLDALWDLVWAGEVTNDTFAPLRALRWKRTGERRAPDRRPTRPADRARSARGRRPLVARRARGGTRDRHGTAPRPEPGPPRPARCRDPRGRRDRGGRGRVRGGLPGPAGDGGRRPDPARLLRGRSRGGPVRARRGARPVARDARAGRSRVARRGPPPGRRGSRRTRTARRLPGRGVARPTGGRSSARPAPTSSWWTASRRSTWSVAGRRSRRCPRPTTRPWRSPRSVPCARSWPTDASASSSSARSMATTSRCRRGDRSCSRPASRPAIAVSCFVPPPDRGLSARRRHALPDGRGSPAVPRRADRHCRSDRRARVRSRRSRGSSVMRSQRSRRSARTS